MPQLVLIRHSQSKIDPQLPARAWVLTVTGQQRCQALAEALRPYRLERIISSQEPKALETAQLVAQALELPCCTSPGLHEHARVHQPLLTQQDFCDRVAQLFARPDELVFGEETANQAEQRFSQAVEALLVAHPGERLAISTHGTVLSLFMARVCGLDAYGLWQWLAMPAFVVCTYPQGELLVRWKWTDSVETPE